MTFERHMAVLKANRGGQPAHHRMPPSRVQRPIADHLCSHGREAVFTQAVTWLDPSVPTRASGVPWLGEIPAHREVIRLHFLVDGAGQG